MYSSVNWETNAESNKEDYEIIVKDPIKHGQNSQAFVSYLVISNHQVRRRFQDFVQLYKWLKDTHSHCIIPPLPGKHRLEYVTGDRFSKEFLEKRMIGLQCFLSRIQRHSILSKSVCLEKFLEADQMALVDTFVPKNKSLLDSMGEVIINAFVHLKGDEEYLQLKTAIEKCEKNLMKIESLNTNVLKDQQEIAKSFDIVANSIDSLGQMETQMHDTLTKVGKQMKNYSESIKAKADKEDLEYVIPIKEYLQYFDSVRDTLKLRDQKRIDVQELEKYLTQYKSERDELFSRGSSGKIGQFFQDRINDLKGVDPEKTRTERLNKLEERVKQLENALAEAKNENEIFGKNVIEEIEFFNKNKVDDFKVLFQIKTGDEIEFHKSSIAYWDNIINILSDSAAEIENTE